MGFPSLKEDIDELHTELTRLLADSDKSSLPAIDERHLRLLEQIRGFLDKLSNVLRQPDFQQSTRYVVLEWENRNLRRELDRVQGTLTKVKISKLKPSETVEHEVLQIRKENQKLIRAVGRLKQEVSDKNDAIALFKRTGRVAKTERRIKRKKRR